MSTTGFALNQGNNAITSNAGGITIQGSGTTATTVISGSGAFTNAAGNIAISSNNTAAGGNWSINLAGAINQNANGGNISFSSNQAIYQGGTVTVAANTSGTASSVTYNTTTGNRTSQVYTGALTLTGGISASNTDIDYSILTSGAPITVAAISVPGSISLNNSYLNGVAGGITLANANANATDNAAGITAGALTAGRNVNLYGVTSVNNTGLYSIANNGNVLSSQRVSGGVLNITAFASSTTGAGLQGSATNVVFQSGTSTIAGGDITLLGNNNNINATGYWLRNGGNNITAYGANVNWGTSASPVVSGWPNRTTGNITATRIGSTGGNINIYGTTTSAGSFPAFSSSGTLTADGSITIVGTKTVAYDSPVIDITGPIVLTGVIPQSNLSVLATQPTGGGNAGISMTSTITQNSNGGNISFVSNGRISQTGAISLAANTSGNAASITYDTTTGTKASTITSGALTVASGSTNDINFIEKTAGAAISAAAINVPGYILLDNTWGGTAGPGGTPTSGFITSSNFATTATTTANGVTFTGNLTAGKGITLRGASYSANHGVYSAGLNLTTTQGDIVITGISNTGSGYWNQYGGTLAATTGNINFTGYIGAGNAAVNLNTNLITAPQGSITANGTVNGNGLFAVWSSGSISAGAGISITGSTNSNTTYAPVSIYSNLAVTGTGSTVSVSGTRSTAGGALGIDATGSISGGNGSSISLVSNNKINHVGPVLVAANTTLAAANITYDTTTGTKDSTITSGPVALTSGSTNDINFIEKTAGAAITAAAINVPGYILLDNTWGGTAGPGGTPTSGFITSSNYATTATTTANGVTFTGNLTAGKGITLRGASYSANHGVYSAGLNLTTAQGDIVITGISNTGSGYWNQYGGTLTATTGNINFTGYIGAGNAAVNLNTTLITAPQGTITANGTVNGNGLFAVWSSGSISAGAGISITGSTNSNTTYAPVSLVASSLAVTGTGSTLSVSATRSTAGGALGIDTSGTISGGNGSNISFTSNNRINQTGAITLPANTSANAGTISYDTTTGTKDTTITTGPLTVATGSTTAINYEVKASGGADYKRQHRCAGLHPP